MAQPQKRAKPLDPADLPDPLGDSRDVPMASADDLLSEMVGDDVERLMSGEYDPIAPARRPVDQLQQQLGDFLDELRHRERQSAALPPAPPPQPASAAPRAVPHVPLSRRAAVAAKPAAPATLKPATPASAPAALPPQYAYHEDDDEDVAPPLDDLVGPSHEELVGMHSGEFESASAAARGPAESRALLAPVNAAADEPAYLRPLDWISAPIAAMSGGARVAVSLFAIASFLGGCAAIGYVLMLRHGRI